MAVVKITAADPAARRLGSVVESYIPSPASHRCKSFYPPRNYRSANLCRGQQTPLTAYSCVLLVNQRIILAMGG